MAVGRGTKQLAHEPTASLRIRSPWSAALQRDMSAAGLVLMFVSAVVCLDDDYSPEDRRRASALLSPSIMLGRRVCAQLVVSCLFVVVSCERCFW